MWFDTLAIVPFAELRLVRKIHSVCHLLKTLHVIINVGLNFYLILSLDYGIEAVFIANLAASVLITGLIWAATADLWKGNWKQEWVGTIFKFGLPFIPAGLGHATNEMLDRFLLNSMDPCRLPSGCMESGMTPEDVVGIYNACYKLAVFMLLIVQMYRMAWQPFFHAAFPRRGIPPSVLFSQCVCLFQFAFAACCVSCSLALQGANCGDKRAGAQRHAY